MSSVIRIPVAFIDPAIGDLGAPPESLSFLENEKNVFINALKSSFPGVEFVNYDIRDPIDVQVFLNTEGNAVGYVVVTLNSLMGFIDR
ncbi:hypothetical protein [Vulcanisaeta sp. JCM 16161]|uniref:hypothetical protein n=1 Tax=Vulcanisaeta sp. JCM 16161 TaxID=1295372 RepID=UPI000ACE0DBD|nr:hypothetical protein [Vulcanisaeta sp. JCM 16161]